MTFGFRHGFFFTFAALALLGTPRDASADCVNPAAPEGRLVYNSSVKMAQVCDGTNWIGLGGSTGGGGITTAGQDKEIIFNDGGGLTGNPGLVFDKTTTSVGIGVASPTQQLDVAGTATAQGILLKPIAGDPPAPMGAPVLNALADVDTSAQADGLVLTYNGTTSQWEAAAASGGTVTGAAGSAGQVQFNEAGAFAGDAGLFWENTDKRLGIGTTSPAAKLHIVGANGDWQAYFGSASDAARGGIWSGTTGGKRAVFGTPDTGTAVSINTAGSDRIWVEAGGNVGIGTNSPAEKLEVNGRIKASQFCNSAGVCVDPSSLVPTGAVMAFDLTACPTGWSEYTAARGRFLRGIDNGAGNDPGGTRAPGNTQGDDLRSHNHGVTPLDIYNTAAFQINDNSGDFLVSTDNAAPGGNGTLRPNRYYTENSGGAETRPKNVAVLYCRKS